MKPSCFARNLVTRQLLLALVLCAASPAPAFCKASAAAPDPVDPLLTLDGALALALEHNRGVTITALQEQELGHDVSIARSRRLPQFHFDVLAGSLLHSFDFTFPAGSFGSYPGVGSVPSTDAKITT